MNDPVSVPEVISTVTGLSEEKAAQATKNALYRWLEMRFPLPVTDKRPPLYRFVDMIIKDEEIPWRVRKEAQKFRRGIHRHGPYRGLRKVVNAFQRLVRHGRAMSPMRMAVAEARAYGNPVIPDWFGGGYMIASIIAEAGLLKMQEQLEATAEASSEVR